MPLTTTPSRNDDATGETETAIGYHALDQSQPVVEQLAAEEQAYGKALIPRLRHG